MYIAAQVQSRNMISHAEWTFQIPSAILYWAGEQNLILLFVLSLLYLMALHAVCNGINRLHIHNSTPVYGSVCFTQTIQLLSWFGTLTGTPTNTPVCPSSCRLTIENNYSIHRVWSSPTLICVHGIIYNCLCVSIIKLYFISISPSWWSCRQVKERWEKERKRSHLTWREFVDWRQTKTNWEMR